MPFKTAGGGGGGGVPKYHMRGKYNNTQIHDNCGVGENTSRSSYQGNRRQQPDNLRCYECRKQGHIAVKLPLYNIDAQVHTQSTHDLGEKNDTNGKVYKATENNSTHLYHLSLFDDFQET